MIITPKTTVTINGLTYNAETTYNVNHTIFTKMVVAGAMKTTQYIATSTDDVVVEELQTEQKPVRKSTRRRTTKK